MNENLIIVPVIIPLITAILSMFLWFKPDLQRWVSGVGHLISLVIAIFLVTQVKDGQVFTMQAGAWAAPYGISFVLDAFSSLMILMTAISGLAVGIFSAFSIKSSRASFGFFPLIQFLLMGLYGSFLAGDIFNLYVWFEVIIIASFVLITLGGEKAQLAGAMKYVTLNLLASVIFLTGIAVLYGVLGSLNLADLSVKISESPHQNLINTIGLLFLVAFGIKSAIFPLYFWLPDSYHTPPAAVSAIFGGLLTKVGVYAFIRIFSLLFISDVFIRELLVILAILTMFIGAIGAIKANNIRVVFSYLIISHIGFMIGGLGTFTSIALAGALFYLIHDILVKTNVFLISGIIYKFSGTSDITKMGGVSSVYPVLSMIFFVVFFSLVGTPPLSGFWPKLLLIKGALQAENYYLIGGIIIASFLTLWAVVRVWSKVFWTTEQNTDDNNEYSRLSLGNKLGLVIPVVLLAGLTIFISFMWPAISDWCMMIADQLINPETYIEAVMKTKN